MTDPSPPWFREYRVLGIPQTLRPYPEEPVHHILYRAAREHPRMGLVQGDAFVPYPRLKDWVDRLAAALHGMGLEKGDRVASLLPTSIPFEIAAYAVSRAGLVHLPVSPLEPPDLLRHKMVQGAPRVLIAQEAAEPTVQELLSSGVAIERVIRVPAETPPPDGDAPAAGGPGGFWGLIRAAEPDPPAVRFRVEEDLALLLFTGGTTGLPKGCMLTHRNVYANALQNTAGFGAVHRLGRGAVSVLLGLPFHHAYGHCVMHCMTLLGFTQLLVPDPRDTGNMVRMIEAHSPLLQFGVPTQFMNLVAEQRGSRGMIGVSGSAPLCRSTQEAFEARTGGGIMEGYGLSEMSPTTHLNTSVLIRLFGGRAPLRAINALCRVPGCEALVNGSLRVAGSRRNGRLLNRLISLNMERTGRKRPTAGRAGAREKRGTVGIPFPDTEVKLVDVDTGRELSWQEALAGRPGEMRLNGPQRMLGYWPEPGQGIEPDGFVNTRDVVRVDENGYFTVVDRTKDMIIVSGFKVYSREIEEALAGHPLVEASAAVGFPDPEREGSERVAVFVQPRPGCAEKISEDDVRAYLEPRTARYARPRRVIFVEELPRTELQKIDKKALRALVRAPGAGA